MRKLADPMECAEIALPAHSHLRGMVAYVVPGIQVDALEVALEIIGEEKTLEAVELRIRHLIQETRKK